MTTRNCSALIVIDVQKGFDAPSWGQRNNPDAEVSITRLLNLWRKEERPIIQIQHCSIEPDSPLRPNCEGNQFKEGFAPLADEVTFQKSVNSAFIGTDLEHYLRNEKIEYLVVVGLATDHCISTTTRMAGNLGFHVDLVADATATFDRTSYDGTYYSAEEIHQVHLASLHSEFCQVVKTADILDR